MTGLENTDRTAPPRYLPGSGIRAPAGYAETTESWSMPQLGLVPALLLPARLNRAVARSATDPRSATVPLEHVARHFGRGLIRYVDPQAIDVQLSQRVLSDGRMLRLSRRFLDAGDWRAVTLPFKTSFIRRAMDELAAHGDSFSTLTTYRALVQRAARGRPHRYNGVALDTPARIDGYFRRYHRLIENVRAHGLRPHCAVDSAAFGRDPEIRLETVERSESEIGLAIGADGRFYRFLGGRHRTAVAQALGLPLMPVRVRIVHARWLADLAESTGVTPYVALRNWLEWHPAWDARVA